MKTTKPHKKEKIPFIRYWKELTVEERKELIYEARKHLSESNLYACIRKNKFTALQQFYLESILNQKFNWNE